ncbi:hypothetical protein [Nonomuraea typhae]|uniref:Uncharacterized protein n=1 Tax=Nonomuraea typhae TaxID=2603600 RepID=A0ABW7Z773_9ACTN
MEEIRRPEKPASAVWLREHLAELWPGEAPFVHEWADPYRVRRAGEPVGYRHLVLAAAAGRVSPGVDGVLEALRDAGWKARDPHVFHGESVASATLDAFKVRVYEGAGPGVLYVCGWTPVVFRLEERPRRQPRHTVSTVWEAVLCDECDGLGACPECEGTLFAPHTFRRGSYSGYGCLGCNANNTGPGNCASCGSRGCLPAGSPYGEDGRPGLADVTADTRTVASGAEALAEVVRRPCAGCGEVRGAWRNAVVQRGDDLLSCYFATCPDCGARRAHSFQLSTGG